MTRFAFGIGWRIATIVVLTGAMVTLYTRQANLFWLFPLFVLNFSLSINLYQYVTGLNRKLTRFLESVRYSDFTVAFRADSNMGPSFRDLNDQFNEVLDAFRQARAEKEANLHYVNTIVQHVSVGLLTFDATGQVELVNQTALRLLGIYRLRTLTDLNATHPDLAGLLRSATGASAPVAYQTGTDGELSVRCTAVRLRGRLVTVASLQNIRSELQQRELEAWQNLTKVLRHEIMNSITPIVSLAGTMRDIVETDLAKPVAHDPQLTESVNDLRDALTTIEQRGAGVMQFVDAYRHFTTIPQPVFADVSVENLLRNVAQLAQPDAQKSRITITTASPNLAIRADTAQIEMVLLNLVKNAVESLEKTANPAVRLEAGADGPHVVIRVSDNGPGIEPEALEQIFIPFYTTKKTGSGIGLSLSRQIMQLHGGSSRPNPRRGRAAPSSYYFETFDYTCDEMTVDMINSVLANELPTVTRILRENGVKRAYAFGSVCTDRFNEDSDIDLLIAFDDALDPVRYGENYFAIAHALESVLNRSVDLVTERSLQNPHFIATLNKTKTAIYE